MGGWVVDELSRRERGVVRWPARLMEVGGWVGGWVGEWVEVGWGEGRGGWVGGWMDDLLFHPCHELLVDVWAGREGEEAVGPGHFRLGGWVGG